MAEILSMQGLLYGGILLVAFLTVTALIVGAMGLFGTRVDPVRARLERTVANAGGPALPEGSVQSRSQSFAAVFELLLRPFAGIASPKDPDEMGQLRKKLVNAGLRSDNALGNFLGIKTILCLATGVSFLLVNAFLTQGVKHPAIWTLGLMAVGYYLPNLWLSSRIQERQTAIRHGLPDALDLTVTCVEGGLGLDATLNRVADEINLSSPLLAAELTESALEMRAGMLRREAFRRMAERTGVDELSQLAAIIYQTEMFGTSIAQALRVLAEGLRVRRMQLAEEKAATVAVKMAIPLVFNILPTLLMLLLGSVIVRFATELLPRLAGE